MDVIFQKPIQDDGFSCGGDKIQSRRSVAIGLCSRGEMTFCHGEVEELLFSPRCEQKELAFPRHAGVASVHYFSLFPRGQYYQLGTMHSKGSWASHSYCANGFSLIGLTGSFRTSQECVVITKETNNQ